MRTEDAHSSFPARARRRSAWAGSWPRAYPEARAAFDEASEALGFDVAALCWEGPEAELQLTANTQPAILAASVAIARGARCPRLGVPTLLPATAWASTRRWSLAGVLPLAAAVRLVRRRGELMQEAVPVGVGAMAAMLGLDSGAVRDLAAEAAADSASGEVCAVANYNSPEQTVIAGHKAAVERAMALAT